MINLSAFVAYHATREPDRPAFIYQDVAVTYSDFSHRIGRMAGLLQSHGIGKGDVVALFMKNSPAFLEIAFAASHLGAIFLPINYRLAASEVNYIVSDSGARLVFCDTEFEQIGGQLETPCLFVDSAAQADSRHLSRDMDSVSVPAMTLVSQTDTFRLMYTSGTTSRPKGVVHSYDNFYWKNIDHVMALGITATDRLLVVGPLYHVGAFDLPGMSVLWMGGVLCLHREFDPHRALESIERHGLTCGWMAPVMLNRVLEIEDAAVRYDLRSLRWCIGGGERTPESRIRQFSLVFTNGRYVDGYGLTESCSGDTLMEPGMEVEKIGSTGRPLAHVELTIRDGQGRRLPVKEVGEICLRGPKVTRCYWNAPEKTREAFFDDWFRTGDMGYLDEDGFLFIADRVKDMILSGGENIASSEIEEVVYKLPEVSEVAVVGVPDPQWGERPVAFVVLKDGLALNEDAIRAHCREHLAGFKVPGRVVFANVLPRNPSGKVLKRKLRENIDDLLAASCKD